MPNQNEKNNNDLIVSIDRQLLKNDIKLTEVVQDVSDIKSALEDISHNVSEIQKTLVVQSHQLGEHMRRTDALEKIVQKTKHDQNDYQMSTGTRLTVLETDKANAKELRVRDFAIIGIVVALIEVVIKFME